jgi:hypothetical protein
MKVSLCKTLLVFLIFFLAGCTSKKDIFFFFFEQINNTAATFFYDDKDLPSTETQMGKYIKRDGETGGICQDYASPFIDSYSGLGDIYYLEVNDKGEASLRRRVKLFKKNDIIVNDTMTVESFIEETYQWVISNNEEGSIYIIDDKEKKRWSNFYIYTTNGMTYWSEKQFDLTLPLIPLKKEHIKINLRNYQAERSKQRKEYIDSFYAEVIQLNEDKKGKWSWWGWGQGRHDELAGWYISPIKFHTTEDGRMFLIEEISIPTPEFHAGKTEKEKFFNHAWVRIIWREKTIDIDPTWYDNGIPLELGAIEEIIPNKVNSYPEVYSDYFRQPNTRLISPITGTLKSGSSQTFVISSEDYSVISVIIDGNNRYDFTKNDKTGNYELVFTIPENLDIIKIYGITVSENTWEGDGLIWYNIEKE